MSASEDFRAARLAELQARRAPVVRVLFCSVRNVWDWAVTHEGQVIATGSEPTKEEAEREADAHREPATAPPFVPGKRHLLYHILPVANNGTWQRNLDQLRVRLPLFDGKKVVAVMREPDNVVRDDTTNRGRLELDPPDAVYEYLDGCGCEFLEIDNDAALREVKSWGKLWISLANYANTSDVVFYAHAKGVTRPFDPGVTVHPWTRIMYASLLDYWPVVDDLLRRYPLAGSFKKVGFGFQGSRSSWHYSGSFFWARVGEVFRHGRWKAVDSAWWGNEAWPGCHWPAEQAGCVFHEGDISSLNLFDMNRLNAGLPSWMEWTKANAGRRTCWT